MAEEKNKQEGLFWNPLGGNNLDQFSGNCHYYNLVTKDENNNTKEDGVIIDIGYFDNYDGIADVKSESAFADVRDILKEKKAGAVLLTHGHIDHIGAVAEYVRLGYDLPPIYAGKFTEEMLKRSFATKKIPYDKWPEIRELKPGMKVKVGGMEVEAVSASHSVPDAFSFYIKTDKGSLFHTGDFKMDQTVNLGQGTDINRLKEIGNDGVDAMVADATTVFNEGYAREEKEVEETYAKLFKEAKGRQIIVSSAGGHMERTASILKAAKEAGRTVVNAGTAYQKTHIRALKKAGYDITFDGEVKLHDSSTEAGKNVPAEDAVIITSSSYREKASLDRALAGKKAPFKVEKNALVILDSRHVSDVLRANAEKIGVQLVTPKEQPGISGSGHAQKEDMLDIAEFVKPAMIAATHCHKERGQEFNETLRKEGLKTCDAPVNGMTFKVVKGGLELVAMKLPKWVISNSVEGSEWQAKETTVIQKPSKGKGGVPFRKSLNLTNKAEFAKQKIAEYKVKNNSKKTKKVVAEIIKNQQVR